MSKHINVNPDHYKVAGRERQGEGTVRKANQELKTRSRTDRTRNLIPGAKPVGVSGKEPKKD